METFEYIDDYKGLPNVSSIHCDTRDFYVICYNVDSAYRRRVLKGIHRQAGYGTLSDCRFTKDEILPILKDLETRSGGKGKWRMITTEHYKEWLKYIQFIKDGNTYIAYDNDYNVLSRTILTEPINKEHLAFQ